MNIIKYKSEFGFNDFYIEKEGKTLEILFGGNGDLYWIIDNIKIKAKVIKEFKKHLESTYQEKFIITKENYFIYQLFEELINDIENSRIYLPVEDELKLKFDELYENTRESSKERCDILNQHYKKYFRYKLLFENGVICWHSDEHIFEDADRVKIIKLEDNIILDFSRPPVKEEEKIYHLPGRIAIRFRNSGSNYDPYNIIFMRMFQKLQEYDPSYHQIHIEELEYQKKLKKQLIKKYKNKQKGE